MTVFTETLPLFQSTSPDMSFHLFLFKISMGVNEKLNGLFEKNTVTMAIMMQIMQTLTFKHRILGH